MIQSIQQGFLADGVAVPLTKLCTWFGVPHRPEIAPPLTQMSSRLMPRH